MSDDDKTKTDDAVEEATEDEKPAEEEKEETESDDKPDEEPEEEESKDEKSDDDKGEEEKPASGEPEATGTDQQGRQLYKVKCSKCGKDTEVPFEPSGDRPVYCRDCYMQQKNS